MSLELGIVEFLALLVYLFALAWLCVSQIRRTAEGRRRPKRRGGWRR
jgi:hypothetical protein